MGIADMKVLLFADTRELCLEAWKRSHIGSAVQLCFRFADVQELLF